MIPAINFVAEMVMNKSSSRKQSVEKATTVRKMSSGSNAPRKSSMNDAPMRKQSVDSAKSGGKAIKAPTKYVISK